MFVASTELLNIVSLHACREQVSSVGIDFSLPSPTPTVTAHFRVRETTPDWFKYGGVKKCPA